MIEEASGASALDAEGLIQAINRDERLSDLFNEAVQAAATSSLSEKRKALGRVLAQAVAGDDAAVEEALLLTHSMSHLEPLHVRVIAGMYERAARGGRLYSSPTDTWFLAHRCKLDREVVEPLLLQLESWGIVTSSFDFGKILRQGLDDHTRGSAFIGLGMRDERKFKLTQHGLDLIGYLASEEVHEEEKNLITEGDEGE